MIAAYVAVTLCVIDAGPAGAAATCWNTNVSRSPIGQFNCNLTRDWWIEAARITFLRY
jgi:hypothetical protein